MVVMGDHQAAPIITGDAASWDVPVHIISRDRALVQAFIDSGGFTSGFESPPAVASLGMDKFRGLMHRLFQAQLPVVAKADRSGASKSNYRGTDKL